MHHTPNLTHKVVQIGKQQVLSDIFARLLWHLEDAEADADDEITEVVHECRHVQLPTSREVSPITLVPGFRVVVPFQPVHRRLERAQNAIEVNRIRNLTQPIGILHDDTVGSELADDVIIQIEVYPFIIRSDLHEDMFKTRVPAHIPRQMLDVSVAFAQQLPMCDSEVFHAKCLGFWHIHRLGE